MSNPSPTDAQSQSGPPLSSVLDQMFHALSHPMRRQILVVLFARGGSMAAGEIADRFKCSWPTTTRHLGVLEKSGAILVEKQGRNRVYSLAAHPLLRAADWIYSWAGMVAEGTGTATSDNGTTNWKSLPYASMRNAIPPVAKTNSKTKQTSKKRAKQTSRKKTTKKASRRKKSS